MRTPFTNTELESYVSNDRVTISIRRDDLVVAIELVSEEYQFLDDSIDPDAEFDPRKVSLDRLAEVFDIALRTQ